MPIWAFIIYFFASMENTATQKSGSCAAWCLGLLRIAFGWMFFWAFIDKVWGLGYATKSGKGWVDGVSPTMGFLKNAAKGPFTDLFHALAGNMVVDWLFMLGLLGIGLAFIFGIGVRIASWSAFAMVVMMWAAVLPPANNPFLDDHIIYAIVFVWFSCNVAVVGESLGLGKWWGSMSFVQKMPWLK